MLRDPRRCPRRYATGRRTAWMPRVTRSAVRESLRETLEAEGPESVLAFVMEPIGGLSAGAYYAPARVLPARARDLRRLRSAADLRRGDQRRRSQRSLSRCALVARIAAGSGRAGQGPRQRLLPARVLSGAGGDGGSGRRRRRLLLRTHLQGESARLCGRPGRDAGNARTRSHCPGRCRRRAPARRDWRR